jgi:Tfp pilus assembly protein PilP
MESPRQIQNQESGRRKQGKWPLMILLFAVSCLLLYFPVGLAAQDVIFKGPKGKRDLSKAAKGDSMKPQKGPGSALAFIPEEKTDPFKSFISEREAKEGEREDGKPRTYLETLDVSQVDLIAVIRGPKGNWAMVRDGKGVGYSIQKGTRIGIRNGIVKEIRDSEVIIIEKYRVFGGETRFREVTKKLVPAQ